MLSRVPSRRLNANKLTNDRMQSLLADAAYVFSDYSSVWIKTNHYPWPFVIKHHDNMIVFRPSKYQTNEDLKLTLERYLLPIACGTKCFRLGTVKNVAAWLRMLLINMKPNYKFRPYRKGHDWLDSVFTDIPRNI